MKPDAGARPGVDRHFWRGIAAVLVIYAGGCATICLIWVLP
jgi:hypothetical protein